jgi:hypothetical protein
MPWNRLPVTLMGAATLALSLLGLAPGEVSGQPTPTPGPVPRGVGKIPYPVGWNLVSGTTGTMPCDGNPQPLFTWQAGDTSYEMRSSAEPLHPGVGYWIYFPSPASLCFPAAGGILQPFTLTLPPEQWIMIGDPFPTAATVTGADLLLTYDQIDGYRETDTLQPGQGAWAYARDGATVTLIPFSSVRDIDSSSPLPHAVRDRL